MAGLSRYDMYPRDFRCDTIGMSNEDLGFYTRLLNCMYERGDGLPYDLQYLKKVGEFDSVRPLKRVLGSLIEAGKIRVVDGKLINNRAMEEIAKANRIIANGRKGGLAPKKPVAEEFIDDRTPDEIASDEGFPEVAAKFDRSLPEVSPKPAAGFERNQSLSTKPPSPSPSPSIKEGCAATRARARQADPVIQEARNISERLMEPRGVRNDPSFNGHSGQVEVWLRREIPGWLVESAINEVWDRAEKKNQRIRSFAYFNEAVLSRYNQFKQDPNSVSATPTSSKGPRNDRHRENRRAYETNVPARRRAILDSVGFGPGLDPSRTASG